MSKYFYQVQSLNKLGVSYFEFGTIKQGRIKLYDYYKTDRLTPIQKNELIKLGCKIYKVGSTYAPEIIKAAICFPTKRAA